MVIQETSSPVEIHPLEYFRQKYFLVFTSLTSHLLHCSCKSSCSCFGPEETDTQDSKHFADVDTVIPAGKTDDFRPAITKHYFESHHVIQRDPPLQTVAFLLEWIDRRGIHRKRLHLTS